MREFFGIGGYQREAEGFLSWQHLTFVTALMVIMVFLAMWLGNSRKDRSLREKNRVLIAAAILIDGFELFKIVTASIIGNDPWHFLHDLPLFLCSIQLITIPMAAFGKGRFREAALDFVSIFGLLGAVLGTYGAGNNYGSYPVLCFDNVVSGITHSISGFSALYIMISGLCSMRRRNISVTFTILMGFCAAAYIANICLDYNYMFLMSPDGTPYEILYRLVDGDKFLYPMGVILLFVVYISVFYSLFYLLRGRKISNKKFTAAGTV